jgi:uncharacterized protein (DUF2237 family)
MSTKNKKQQNVLGEDLEECSNNPLTGWYRDGCCNTDENDHGVHTVCAKVTTEFLEWLKVAGNDLITPHPEFGFPGLKDGDGWCVCASWYAKAVEAGKGCPVFLKRTHKNTLKHVPIETLKKVCNRFILNYIFPYLGPPLPSGVTQVIFWDGSLISQVLQ